MRNVVLSARSLAGDEAVERAFAAMDPEQAEELREVLPSGWCRITTGQAFHHRMAEIRGEAVADWHRKVVRAGLERTFGGVWGVFLRIVSVPLLVKRGAAVYAKAYDRGTVKVEAASTRSCTMAMLDWPGVPAMELDGLVLGICTLLEMAGCRDVHAQWVRIPEGARFYIRIDG